MRLGGMLVGVVAVAHVGCGGSTDGGAGKAESKPKPQAAQPKSRCLDVPKGGRSSIAAGLKSGHKPVGLSAVRSKDKFDGLNDLRLGVYFVSADVKPSPGIATWAVGEKAFKTGGGAIVAADSASRAASTLGVDIPSRTVVGWGITPDAEGYEASRACVGK